jgi:hypothetical protein
MKRLFDMVLRVVMWGAAGAVIGFVGTMMFQMAFQSGALELKSTKHFLGGQIGAAIGMGVGRDTLGLAFVASQADTQRPLQACGDHVGLAYATC